MLRFIQCGAWKIIMSSNTAPGLAFGGVEFSARPKNKLFCSLSRRRS